MSQLERAPAKLQDIGYWRQPAKVISAKVIIQGGRHVNMYEGQVKDIKPLNRY